MMLVVYIHDFLLEGQQILDNLFSGIKLKLTLKLKSFLCQRNLLRKYTCFLEDRLQHQGLIVYRSHNIGHEYLQQWLQGLLFVPSLAMTLGKQKNTENIDCNFDQIMKISFCYSTLFFKMCFYQSPIDNSIFKYYLCL